MDNEMIKADDLIIVRQIPIIEEQLKNIKADIEKRVESVLALECNNETVKAIKVLRSALTKDYKELEIRRKMVKEQIMKPYKAFEKIYKECVSDVFESADTELKTRIDSVENAIKEEIRSEVTEYFEEYRISRGIDFITFEDANINIIKSASMKSLKVAAKAFIDRVADDLNLISTQEYKEEILVEYKRTLNVSASITSVTERRKAIEAERAKYTQPENIPEKTADDEADKPLSAPKVKEKIYRTTFTIDGTVSELKALKKFLQENNYKIVGGK